MNPLWAPDGRRIAFAWDRLGILDLYQKPVPEARFKKQITSGGGNSPQWGVAGREIFFVADDRVMVVPIQSDSSSVEAGKPLALFTLPQGSSYAVSRDGQRFLVSRIVQEASPVTVLLNWRPK